MNYTHWHHLFSGSKFNCSAINKSNQHLQLRRNLNWLLQEKAVKPICMILEGLSKEQFLWIRGMPKVKRKTKLMDWKNGRLNTIVLRAVCKAAPKRPRSSFIWYQVAVVPILIILLIFSVLRENLKRLTAIISFKWLQTMALFVTLGNLAFYNLSTCIEIVFELSTCIWNKHWAQMLKTRVPKMFAMAN